MIIPYIISYKSTAAEPGLYRYTLTLGGTTNQIITLKYTEPGAQQVTKTSINTPQNFTVEAGTTWTATISASPGYTAGTLSATLGTVNADTTVTATAATALSRTITVQAQGVPEGVYFKYTNASGSTVAASTQNGTWNGSNLMSLSVAIKYNTPIHFFWGKSYDTTSEYAVDAATANLYINGSSKGVVSLYCYNIDSVVPGASQNTYKSGNLTADTTFKFVYTTPTNPYPDDNTNDHD